MIVVKNLDLVIVKFKSLLADYDRETLSNLYQPIIGYEALALYFTLWGEGNNQKVASIITHQDLVSRMGMSMTDFVKSRRKLEAIGLLTTTLEKNNDVSIYTYNLFAPKAPFQFFDDTLFYGLLVNQIGDQQANRLKSVLCIDKDTSESEDISATFGEVFHPDFNDPIYSAVSNTSWDMVGRKSKKVVLEFSYDEFFKQLKTISQLQESAFTKKDMKEIARMASLYGIDELAAASIVNDSYNESAPKGERIDFNKINKEFQNETNYRFLKKKNNEQSSIPTSDSDLANKVKLLETCPPKKFLSVIQNGTKPCSSDLNIINSLSKDYNLSNGVINVVIDFVTNKNNNVLSKAYAEKIAASLVRSNITSALDAMNYLNGNIKSNDTKIVKDTNKNDVKEESVDTKEETSLDDDWSKLFEGEE